MFNPRLSPVTEQHVQELQEIYPDHSNFIREVYEAMTLGLAPQVNLLVMFAVLREQYRLKSAGILEKHRLLYVPLSIVAKTGKSVWTRFRPKSVKELHTAFLSFMMAETNRNKVNAVCGNYGLGFGQAHCCGVLFGKPGDIKEFQNSKLYKDRNFLRSFIESQGMQVNEVSFDQIPSRNIDLGVAEREFFEMYDKALGQLTLPQSSDEVPGELLRKANDSWEKVLLQTPTMETAFA
jgi:hypothetical protein